MNFKEISGDITKEYRLSLADKLKYLLFNIGRGILGYFVLTPRGVWRPNKEKYQNAKGDDSPGRILIDSFLEDKISELFRKERSLRVFDVGCGTGYMRPMLSEMGYVGFYDGLDVSDELSFGKDYKDRFDFRFIKSKIEDFNPEEPYDLVLSNTAFEHIEDDSAAAKKSFALAGEHGVQIHIVPSFWSIFCYLFHGYRQYSPKRLKKLFGHAPSWRIYAIGGLGTFLLYFLFITIPERLIRTGTIRKTKWYPRLRTFALTLDRYLPLLPLFYAVIVDSRNRRV